jgi:hypothetical protein
MIPARVLSDSISVAVNSGTVETLVISKLFDQTDVEIAYNAKKAGIRVVFDVCDPRSDEGHHNVAAVSDLIVCPTEAAADMMKWAGKPIEIIPDSYEMPELPPHGVGDRKVWFGSLRHLSGILSWEVPDVVLVTKKNVAAPVVPWSVEAVQEELTKANVALFPATAAYKSHNRLIEALRMGCWAICGRESEFSRWVYTGHWKMGMDVARAFAGEINDRISEAQKHIRERYSPEAIGALWRAVL